MGPDPLFPRKNREKPIAVGSAAHKESWQLWGKRRFVGFGESALFSLPEKKKVSPFEACRYPFSLDYNAPPLCSGGTCRQFCRRSSPLCGCMDPSGWVATTVFATKPPVSAAIEAGAERCHALGRRNPRVALMPRHPSPANGLIRAMLPGRKVAAISFCPPFASQRRPMIPPDLLKRDQAGKTKR